MRKCISEAHVITVNFVNLKWYNNCCINLQSLFPGTAQPSGTKWVRPADPLMTQGVRRFDPFMTQ